MAHQPPKTTHSLALRHEALWLALTALHRDVSALAKKHPATAVSEPLRIAAEGLLADGAPFLPRKRMRLPVAAPELMGLAVQLGQALAGLEAWETGHSFWDAGKACRCWRVGGEGLPVMRLRPQLPPPPTVHGGVSIREALAKRIDQRRSGDFEAGFAAGRAARQGKPVAEIEAEARKTYPHIRRLE